MNNRNEKISIIIPVYNVEQYIDRCLSSVISQTYRNIEIIVVIDGSKDGSEEICEKYAKNDKRIKIIKQENKGLSAARNNGLEHASGQYVMFVDSDDYVDENFCLTPYQKLIETGSDIVMFDYMIYYRYKTRKRLISDTEFTVEAPDILKLNLEKVIREAIWNKIYKIEMFDNVRFPEGEIYEDYGTTYLILENCRKLTFIKQYLYHYLIRRQSLSHNDRLITGEAYFKQVSKKYRYLMSKYPDLKEYCAKLYFSAVLQYCNRISTTFGNKEKLVEFRQEAVDLNEKYKFYLDFDEKVNFFLFRTNIVVFSIFNRIRLYFKDKKTESYWI